MHTPGIIVLAAGQGTRYQLAGGHGNKLLARYDDTAGDPQPLLMLTLQTALQSGLPVVLVTRPEYGEIQQHAQQAGVQLLTLSSAGSGESIDAAVRATPRWQGWLIQPGDMAWITAEDHLRVAQALQQGAEQVRLSWQHQPGHPVGFAAAYGKALGALQGDQGARSLLDRAHLVILDAHAGVIRDADLPVSDQ